MAVSSDRKRWTLLNASPDLRSQILATPALQPQAGGPLRHSPIQSVVLTGAEMDQITGLLSLREGTAFSLLATPTTLASVSANPIFDALRADVVTRRSIVPGHGFALPCGLRAELFVVPGKVPLYLESGEPETDTETAGNVGVELSDGRSRLCVVPGAARVSDDMRARFERADAILFDGTLFADDEMSRAGVGVKTGRRMGHMPVSGADGSIAALADIKARKIFVHINTTNPMLVDGSPEHEHVLASGWEIGWDGMEIEV